MLTSTTHEMLCNGIESHVLPIGFARAHAFVDRTGFAATTPEGQTMKATSHVSERYFVVPECGAQRSCRSGKNGGNRGGACIYFGNGMVVPRHVMASSHHFVDCGLLRCALDLKWSF
jgi:hypothetical protein